MSTACAVDPGLPLPHALVAMGECATAALAGGGYDALGGAGGPVAATLTGALTLFVAFFGWRLMLGRATLNVGALGLAALRIGLVLALAGNWSLYQQLIARPLLDTPGLLAQAITGGDPRAAGLPLDHLQAFYTEMQAGARALGAHADKASPLTGGDGFAAMALNGASWVLVLDSAGIAVAARLGLALMLALGPMALGFALFGATRGLLVGWVRALLALALAPLAVAVLTTLEVTAAAPTLAALAGQRAAQAIQSQTACAAAMIVLVFALVVVAGLFACVTVARAFRLPDRTTRTPAVASNGSVVAPVLDMTGRSRVAALADAVTVAVARTAPDRARSPRITAPALSAERWRTATAGPADDALSPRAVGAHRPRRQLLVARRSR